MSKVIFMLFAVLAMVLSLVTYANAWVPRPGAQVSSEVKAGAQPEAPKVDTQKAGPQVIKQNELKVDDKEISYLVIDEEKDGKNKITLRILCDECGRGLSQVIENPPTDRNEYDKLAREAYAKMTTELTAEEKAAQKAELKKRVDACEIKINKKTGKEEDLTEKEENTCIQKRIKDLAKSSKAEDKNEANRLFRKLNQDMLALENKTDRTSEEEAILKQHESFIKERGRSRSKDQRVIALEYGSTIATNRYLENFDKVTNTIKNEIQMDLQKGDIRSAQIKIEALEKEYSRSGLLASEYREAQKLQQDYNRLTAPSRQSTSRSASSRDWLSRNPNTELNGLFSKLDRSAFDNASQEDFRYTLDQLRHQTTNQSVNTQLGSPRRNGPFSSLLAPLNSPSPLTTSFNQLDPLSINRNRTSYFYDQNYINRGGQQHDYRGSGVYGGLPTNVPSSTTYSQNGNFAPYGSPSYSLSYGTGATGVVTGLPGTTYSTQNNVANTNLMRMRGYNN